MGKGLGREPPSCYARKLRGEARPGAPPLNPHSLRLDRYERPAMGSYFFDPEAALRWERACLPEAMSFSRASGSAGSNGPTSLPSR
jgi:hypothetical protein